MFRRIPFRPVVKKKKPRERGTFANCLSLGSISFVLFRRMYFITLDYHSLSEKLVAALLVTGECGAETKGDIFTCYRPTGKANIYITCPLVPSK